MEETLILMLDISFHTHTPFVPMDANPAAYRLHPDQTMEMGKMPPQEEPLVPFVTSGLGIIRARDECWTTINIGQHSMATILGA